MYNDIIEVSVRCMCAQKLVRNIYPFYSVSSII